MRVATAAYPLDWLDSWAAYEDKLAKWVADADADLLVFPEYGAMELASLAGPDIAGDLSASIDAVSERVADMTALLAHLAAEHACTILAPSAPLRDGATVVNQARLIGPTGLIGAQDKQIMTRFERETWGVASGGPLQLFEVGGIKLGVLICYDAEFPLLGRQLVEMGAEVILCPSCTDALAGYWRVRIGAMARALEGQCVTVQATTVGDALWSPAVDENVGTGGIFAPPDRGFPPTGVIAEGALNTPGWTRATLDPTAIAEVRADGQVLNLRHWSEQ